MQIEQIHPLFVGRVTGVDLRQRLDEGIHHALVSALDRYGALLFSGQDLDDGQMAAFGQQFGPLFNASAGFGVDRQIIRIGNLDEQGCLLPENDRIRQANKANDFWHVDNSFSEPPALYSALLARIVPPEGGETEFADARAAYDDLPEARRVALEGLVAEHSFIHSRSLTGYTQFSDEQRAALPPRKRLLIKTNPRTGRKALYVSSHIARILGMEEDEGRDLVRELTEFATRSTYVYTHRWIPGDLVIYDNRAVLHRARPYLSLTHPRDMRALRVLDEPDPDRIGISRQ
jgi:alpha-ketoglutarate-dependent 2,4-dichlorophenoxyacetate dioxygenase